MRGVSIRNLFGELERRKVFRVAAAYGLAAWLLIESTSVVFPALFVPEVFHRIVVVLALTGFPVAVILAWFFDLTRSGVVRTAPIPVDLPSASSKGRLISFVIIGVLLAAVAYLAVRPGGPIIGDAYADKSIAVLPFVDLSPDQDNAYVSDGLAEELLNDLVRVSGLRVAARTSSFAFRGQNMNIREIGGALNVDTVLEGSIRRSGDRLRVTAQLIDAESGFHLWSDTYDREYGDLLAIQDDISAAIVDALKVKLVGTETVDGFKTRAAVDPLAYDLYLRGQHQWHQRTPETLHRSVELFQAAIEADPNYALAYAGLADAYLLLIGYDNLPLEEARSLAKPAMARALELDPNLAEAYASFGLLKLEENDYRGAELSLRRAIQSKEGYSMAHMWLGLALLPDAGPAAAHPEFLRAFELDPLHPTVNANVASNLARLGRHEEARERWRGLIDIAPDSESGYFGMAETALVAGRFDEAITWMEQVPAGASHKASHRASLASVHAMLGDFERANALLDQLNAESGPDLYVMKAQNLVWLLRGEFDRVVVPPADLVNKPFEEGMARIAPGIARIMAGDYRSGAAHLEAAIAVQEEMTKYDPSDRIEIVSFLAYAYQQLGQEKRAEDLLNEILASTLDAQTKGWRSAGLTGRLAGVYVLLGRDQEALDAFTRAVNSGWREYWYVKDNPIFANLADNEAIRKLLVLVEEDVAEMRARVQRMDEDETQVTEARARAGR